MYIEGGWQKSNNYFRECDLHTTHYNGFYSCKCLERPATNGVLKHITVYHTFSGERISTIHVLNNSITLQTFLFLLPMQQLPCFYWADPKPHRYMFRHQSTSLDLFLLQYPCRGFEYTNKKSEETRREVTN